ncbi:hypothetical protein JCM11251_001658 [Rhodosporidiobolus azoricus]
MPPSEALTRVLLLPLHLSVIVSLHACFAGCRALRLAAHLLPRLQLTLKRQETRPTPTGDLAAERWKKVPKHLAVRLAPARVGWRLFPWRRGEEDELREMVEQVEQLVAWCRELGIETMSIYDETGILVRRASDVATALSLEPLVLKKETMQGCVTLSAAAQSDDVASKSPAPGGTETRSPPTSGLDDGESGSSATLVNDESPLSSSTSPGSFKLHLLSREAGRPQLAQVAQALALRQKPGQVAEELTTEAVSVVLDALPFTEPDLLFVLGGPYLRLCGFPPWQIKLSEMYHHPSPSWLPPPRLTYEIFRPALDVYGGAEMRLGR